MEQQTRRIALRYACEDSEIARVLCLQEEELKKLREQDPTVYCIEIYDKKESMLSALEGKLEDLQYTPVTGHYIEDDIEKFRKYVQADTLMPIEVRAGMEAAQQCILAIAAYHDACAVQGAVSSALLNVLKTVREQTTTLAVEKKKLAEERTAFEKEKSLAAKTLAVDRKHYEDLEKLLRSDNSLSVFKNYFALVEEIGKETEAYARVLQLLAETEQKAPPAPSPAPVLPKSEQNSEDPDDLLKEI